MKNNINGEEYKALNIDLWDFKWTTFTTEEYEPDQLFIVHFNDDEILLIKYDALMDIPALKLKGIKAYHPVNLGYL